MGNICRSPSAEGFFRHHLDKSTIAGQVRADSAGTHSYHLGCAPDPRAITEADRFGVDISHLRARKVQASDFEAFDLALAMDRHNLMLMEQMRPAQARADTGLMIDYVPGSGLDEVPDPYYGSQRDFRLMCELLDQATRNLVQQLESRLTKC